MAILDRERTWQFNIRIDGVLCGHVVQRGRQWRLLRADREDLPGYEGIDVTVALDEPQALASMLRRHLQES